MKKFLVVSLLSLSLLSACSSQWNYEAEYVMTEEQKAYHEEILQSSLDGLEEDPESIDLNFEVAFRYHQLGDLKSAVEYYEKVLSLNENHDVALNNLASLYEDVEDYEHAAEYVKRLYELNPASVEVIKDTVRILLLADQGDAAQEALDNFEKVALVAENPDQSIQDLVDELNLDIEEWRKGGF